MRGLEVNGGSGSEAWCSEIGSFSLAGSGAGGAGALLGLDRELRHRKVGRNRFYRIDPDGLHVARAAIEAFLVSDRVSRRHDGRVRALLLKARARSPRKLMISWRLLDMAAYRRECSW